MPSSAVKAHLKKKTHKDGIELPSSVDHARELDRINGNTVGIAFEILEEGAPVPRGWNKVTGHPIWDVEMDITRKAHLVLGGHKCADSEGST